MVIFLILLYILKANGVIIPLGCFVATWILTVTKAICGFISSYEKSKK